MKVITEITPSKEIIIKSNNQDMFGREVAYLIHVREGLFLKFKTPKLYIGEEIYKKIRNQVEKLTRNATRCNNRDDLLHLNFILKMSIFSEAYI